MRMFKEQKIGVFDLHGKELREGDIVFIDKYKFVGCVTYSTQLVGFILKNPKKGIFPLTGIDRKNLKIVGKDSDLMKGGLACGLVQEL